MGTDRQDRVNDAVSREMNEILRKIQDPRVRRAFVSVSGAKVSGDLSEAKIFYSVLGPDEGVREGLESATGFIRTELAHRLNLRITPKLRFVRDHGAEHAMDIALILKEEQTHASPAEPEDEGTDGQQPD
ncbi:MAG: 30S ribosome-binding factor RbfA [Clostridia bacterium]|nr:30S ribosome-binding factor RbfA [Clostridia bacterium]